MKQQYNSDKVLVIQNGLGDLIASSNAFKLFKQLNPHIDLYLATWPGIFTDSQTFNPYLKAVYAVSGQPHEQYNWCISHGWQHSEIHILDNIIHFGRFLHPQILVKLNEQLQIEPQKLNYLLQQYNAQSDGIGYWWRTLKSLNLNLIDGYNLMLNGVLSQNYTTEFFISPNDIKYSNELKDFVPYIVINHTTGSNQDQKQWSISNWHTLLTLILDNTHFNLLTVGGPSDIIIPFPNNKRVKHLRDTNIRELYPIIEHAAYYIVSQSGIAWLASATNTPGLQINIGSPKEIAGSTSKFVTIVDQKELFNPNSVSLEDVWKPLKELLNNIC